MGRHFCMQTAWAQEPHFFGGGLDQTPLCPHPGCRSMGSRFVRGLFSAAVLQIPGLWLIPSIFPFRYAHHRPGVQWPSRRAGHHATCQWGATWWGNTGLLGIADIKCPGEGGNLLQLYLGFVRTRSDETLGWEAFWAVTEWPRSYFPSLFSPCPLLRCR